MGMGLTYIYGLVLTQFSFPLYSIKMVFLQTYKEDFGLETVFNIWWRGNVIESLCRWKDFNELSYMSFIYKGSRLLFNIIIYLQAYKRLPEFSGLMGNVYPGQLKPRFSIPEPRIKSPVSLEWKQIQNEFMEEKDNGLMPSQIIMVKQVSNSY